MHFAPEASVWELVDEPVDDKCVENEYVLLHGNPLLGFVCSANAVTAEKDSVSVHASAKDIALIIFFISLPFFHPYPTDKNSNINQTSCLFYRTIIYKTTSAIKPPGAFAAVEQDERTARNFFTIRSIPRIAEANVNSAQNH